ncbi:MAG: OmpA family protein [Candidatus Korobacteraceae bacterium]|jgi:outer membrane protein OmpA-like peptidoglycan-associated protein
MTRSKLLKTLSIVALLVTLVALSSTIVSAQSAKAEGLITGRSGDTMTIRTADSSSVVVVLTDTTQVAQVVGAFKARRKQMSMAALVPGLQVQVEGSYNPQNQLVATSVKFKGNDLEDAQKIQAGLAPAKEQIQQNEQELAEQKAALARQQQEMQEQQQKMKEAQDKIDANKAAIEAANKRFGQLDDYNILDEVTVYFGNGKVKVDPKYIPQLQELAKKAETINGYVIQVKGYASSVGSASLNQKLSDDRASNVTNILIQQGHVPLTRMLAPGAMGETHQVGNDKTAEGQAENRRVVVRVLQNKGIAGT